MTLGHMHILDANLNGWYLAGMCTLQTLQIFWSRWLSRYNFGISGQNIILDESETPCLGAGQLDIYRNNSANAASAEKSFLPWGVDSWMAITEARSKFTLDTLMHLPFLPPLCSSAPLVLQLSPLPPVGPLLFHPTCVICRFSLPLLTQALLLHCQCLHHHGKFLEVIFISRISASSALTKGDEVIVWEGRLSLTDLIHSWLGSVTIIRHGEFQTKIDT